MESTYILPPNHVSYYEILGLANDCTPKDVKLAYHKLLLIHHPDKQNQKNSNDDNEDKRKGNSQHSIQYIQDAYRILSNEKERLKYDLLLHNHFIKLGLNSNNVHINGIDRIDLSEFEIIEESLNDDNDTQIKFIHSCPRCSFKDGFILTEDDLEKGMIDDDSTDSDHQILIQCASCSLWLCITYSITN